MDSPVIPSQPGDVWDIWVDTGGTFTDCLARSPDATLHRVKVLSTSALRGEVRESIDEYQLRVEASWSAGEDVVRGLALTVPGSPAGAWKVVAFDPRDGRLRVDRLLPALVAGTPFELRSGEEAPILAARLATGTPTDAPLPPIRMRLATTRATNALLERRGSRVAFITTRGCGDLLTIGDQRRPDLFTLHVALPETLHSCVVEVDERLAADGSVIVALDTEGIRPAARALVAEGITVAAVSLLHAYLDDRHERRLEEVLREEGFEHVSCSSALAPSIGHLHRSETAVTNAYLDSVLTGYVESVKSLLLPDASDGKALHLMTSSGGLVGPDNFRPKDSLLSGPAGGVLGAAGAGLDAGVSRVITFDMGGTSTDVARFDGEFDYTWSHQVGGVRLLAPALALETVAAGGGSICGWEAGGLVVGPRSAGANPGPACYGAGGPLTLTDCNLLLGRIDPDRFGVPLYTDRSEVALDELRSVIEGDTGEVPGREDLLEGLIHIADERMADAIRSISVRKGYDPADYALVPFGGAGAQHGSGVARRLGITRQIIPPDGGLLSAVGLGRARIERIAARQVLRLLDDDARAASGWLAEILAALEREAIAAVVAEGEAPATVAVRRRIANLRFQGQETTLPIHLGDGIPLRGAFEDVYAAIYGHLPEARRIEVESVRVFAAGPERAAKRAASGPSGTPPPTERVRAERVRAFFGGVWQDVPAFDRETLQSGAAIEGPCLVRDAHTSIVIDQGWHGAVCDSGAIVVMASEGSVPLTNVEREAPRAVREQLFTSRFEALVDEMGEQLRRTAVSTNVKERLDFSCALLDPHGELVVNAPHIPVHLGALGLCVRSVVGKLPMRSGDVVVTNHPAYGGSHLPDITVIAPVFADDGSLLGYVANRAHHAEIGGTTPGSMPPNARTLEEEGVVLSPTLLVRDGHARWADLERLLSAARYPSRSPADNLADLRAQVAAVAGGSRLLRSLGLEHGPDTVRAQMEALTSRAERGCRQALANLGDVDFSATERLDDGSPLSVRFSIRGGEALIDFTGTAGVHPGNLNATPAVTRSVVLYVLRLLIDDPLPLNEGLFRPITLKLPPSLLNPDFGGSSEEAPAVVGGNTEVSQRLVDTLIRALGLGACSQGTMNNVIWGNDRYGYYETVAGGAGAIEGHAGRDAVHMHMTNTRITDTEILERRYPVRVERFAIRPDSGGGGVYRGGNGVVREIQFLEPATLSVLTQHRYEEPYGMAGGSPGAKGRQTIIRADGAMLELGSVDGAEVEAGDRLVLETPGGGGWGIPNGSSEADRE